MTPGGAARRSPDAILRWVQRRSPTELGGAPSDLIARAVAAEDEYRRMCALQRMDASELRRVFEGDLSETAPWVRAAARLGLAEGQLGLGQMLLEGSGVARDEAAALGWFLSAARKGSPAAMNMAGRCYENGWGAPLDLDEAARWYLRSAEAGHDWGEYNYANMLFDGRGVAQDQPQAVRWYLCAANQGHARAMNLLARCFEEGWGAVRDPAQAFRWYRASAEAGYFRAQFNYGAVLVAVGRVDEAMPWFEAAVRGATPDSLPGMLDLLKAHPEARLEALGERLQVELVVCRPDVEGLEGGATPMA